MNQLLDAVALGQAVAFIPASVASRHAVPDLAFVPVTDLSPSTVIGSLAGGLPVTRHRPLPPHRRQAAASANCPKTSPTSERFCPAATVFTGEQPPSAHRGGCSDQRSSAPDTGDSPE